MPSGWSNKDERQYDHIKSSAKKRGKSTKRAKEIAARTVNKERREEGRTPNKTTQGTGNPNRPLKERTKDELYNIAKEKNISGRSKMKKDELVKAIQKKVICGKTVCHFFRVCHFCLPKCQLILIHTRKNLCFF